MDEELCVVAKSFVAWPLRRQSPNQTIRQTVPRTQKYLVTKNSKVPKAREDYFEEAADY